MQRINFEDLPSTNTPLSANNLNTMQDNIEDSIDTKQDTLVSGTNIKTINNNSILGSGNIMVGGSTPTGSVMMFGGATAPDGYLLCDGTAVSRTTYSDLYDAIGTTYGSGDGSTTFNLPNLKGKVPVGYDSSDSSFDSLGETGGEKTHTLITDEIPSHSHKLPIAGTAGSTDYLIQSYTTATRVNLGDTAVAGGGQAHNNLQPYIVMNYIIKY